MAVRSDIHTKHINTVEILNVKRGSVQRINGRRV